MYSNTKNGAKFRHGDQRSVFIEGFEPGFDAQVRGYALAADAPVEFLVPVVDPPLLIVERYAAKARRHQRLLDLRAELQILIEDAIEIRDASLPQFRRRAA